jgi:hypothetical protein
MIQLGGRSILIEFGIALKVERLINVCLNETYSRVWVGKHLSDRIPFKSGLKEGYALLPSLFNFALNIPLGGFRQTRRA